MPIKFTNNASTRLAAPIDTSTTTITVESGGGDKFPVITAEDYFPITVVAADASLEIMKCTARTADTFTVVRAQEGTTAKEFTAGSVVELRFTAGAIEAVMDELQVKIDDAEQALDDKIDTVEGYKVGDYLTTARNPGANWLRRDGSRYANEDYPDLALIMPPAPMELTFNPFGSNFFSNGDLTDGYYGRKAFATDSNGALICIANGPGSTFGAYRSIDGGETWSYHQIIASKQSAFAQLAQKGDVLMLNDVIKNNRLYYSLNGGVTWTSITYSSSIITYLFYDSLSDCFVGISGTTRTGTTNQVLKSNTVTGASSITMSVAASWSVSQALADSSCCVHGYTFLGQQGDKTYISTDYGATRTAMTVPTGGYTGNGYLDQVVYLGGTYYIRQGDKIYSTTNFTSYTEVETDVPYGPYRVIGENADGIVGFVGSTQLIYSTDGSTWNRFGFTAPNTPASYLPPYPSPNFAVDKTFFSGSNISGTITFVKAQVPEGEEFLVPSDGGGINWIKAL